MSYERRFDWKKLEETRGRRPDDAVLYAYDDRLELAVNVAIASGRPLLLSGVPGTGKSTLAADVAWKLGRRYYPEVITSRTQAQDLQWTFDAVDRLAQATRGDDVTDPAKFIRPGPLWRAFDPTSAAARDRRAKAIEPDKTSAAAGRAKKKGANAAAVEKAAEIKPLEGEPSATAWRDVGEHAVVLFDEIDKAEPDVPNDLLVVLDQREFQVRESREVVRAAPTLEVLIVITTNGERDLPPAFLRRCICHEIVPPADKKEKDRRLKDIARRHFDAERVGAELLDAVYGLYDALQADAKSRSLRQPSVAEMIDALRACSTLRIKDTKDPVWKDIAAAAMWKQPTKPPSEGVLENAGAPSVPGKSQGSRA